MMRADGKDLEKGEHSNLADPMAREEIEMRGDE